MAPSPAMRPSASRRRRRRERKALGTEEGSGLMSASEQTPGWTACRLVVGGADRSRGAPPQKPGPHQSVLPERQAKQKGGLRREKVAGHQTLDLDLFRI